MNTDEGFFEQLQNAQREISNRGLQMSLEPRTRTDLPEEPEDDNNLSNFVMMNESPTSNVKTAEQQQHADDVGSSYEKILKLFSSNQEPLFAPNPAMKENVDDEDRVFFINLIKHVIKSKPGCQEIFKDMDLCRMSLNQIEKFLNYVRQAVSLIEIDFKSNLTLDIAYNILERSIKACIKAQPSNEALLKSVLVNITKTYEASKKTDYQLQGLLHLIHSKDPAAKTHKVTSMTRCSDFLSDLAIPCVMSTLSEVMLKLLDKFNESDLIGTFTVGSSIQFASTDNNKNKRPTAEIEPQPKRLKEK